MLNPTLTVPISAYHLIIARDLERMAQRTQNDHWRDACLRRGLAHAMMAAYIKKLGEDYHALLNGHPIGDADRMAERTEQAMRAGIRDECFGEGSAI
jgi:hypothetical protein